VFIKTVWSHWNNKERDRMFIKLFLFMFAYSAVNNIEGIPLLDKGVVTNQTIDVNYIFVYHERNVGIENLTREVMNDIECVTDIKYTPQARLTNDMSNPLYIELFNCSEMQINPQRDYSSCFNTFIAEIRNEETPFFHLRIFIDRIILWDNKRIKGIILHELLHMVNKQHFNDSEMDAMYPESIDNSEYGIATHELDLIGQDVLIGIPNWYEIHAQLLVGTKYIDDLRYRNLMSDYFNYCRLMSKTIFTTLDRHVHCDSVLNLMRDPQSNQTTKSILDQLFDCVYVQNNILQLCFARTLTSLNEPNIHQSVHRFNHKINASDIANGKESPDENRRNIIGKLLDINIVRNNNRAYCVY
jgi:hypothetical protein